MLRSEFELFLAAKGRGESDTWSFSTEFLSVWDSSTEEERNAFLEEAVRVSEMDDAFVELVRSLWIPVVDEPPLSLPAWVPVRMSEPVVNAVDDSTQVKRARQAARMRRFRAKNRDEVGEVLAFEMGGDHDPSYATMTGTRMVAFANGGSPTHGEYDSLIEAVRRAPTCLPISSVTSVRIGGATAIRLHTITGVEHYAFVARPRLVSPADTPVIILALPRVTHDASMFATMASNHIRRSGQYPTDLRVRVINTEIDDSVAMTLLLQMWWDAQHTTKCSAGTVATWCDEIATMEPRTRRALIVLATLDCERPRSESTIRLIPCYTGTTLESMIARAAHKAGGRVPEAKRVKNSHA